MKILIIIYILWNIVTFITMGIDKYKAKNNKWRISENTLIIIALLMGGVGSIVGSYTFRHKTQKIKFKIMLPLALIVNVIIVFLIIRAYYQIGIN